MEFIKRNFGKMLLAVAVIGFVSYWYASPYLTAYNIRQAVENHRIEKLKNFIDFASLRQNITAQVMNQIQVQAEENPELKNKPEVIALAQTMIARRIQKWVTPQGLVALWNGSKELHDLCRIPANEHVERGVIHSLSRPNFFAMTADSGKAEESAKSIAPVPLAVPHAGEVKVAAIAAQSSERATQSVKSASQSVEASGTAPVAKPHDASGSAPQSSGATAAKYTMDYGNGFNSFYIEAVDPQNADEKLLFEMRRDGFFSWRVYNVLLPFSS